MKRRARKIFIILGIIVSSGFFVYFTKSFWRDQLRAYVLGRVEVTAEYYQHLPEDIDVVEVFTLSNQPNSQDTNGFYGDFKEPLETLQHKTLVGTNATEVVELWRYQAFGRVFQSMCFEPVYGLQFKRKGKIYFQTSVCWHCSIYTLPVPPFGVIENGFYAKSKEGQKLLETLQRHLPLPPDPKKVPL